jgi:VRR-NUC domain
MIQVCPSEHEEQVALIEWVQICGLIYDSRLESLYAIPNGGDRRIEVARKLKAEGVKPGVPDLFLPVADKGYHGLYIEMKRLKNSSTSPEQKKFIAQLNEQGYLAVVCKGWVKAAETLIDYLQLPNESRAWLS